ncbi:MAG: hypothetical protein D6725_01815 [Planctomycetota bacterium]|nr:MAG: hypothetical protein D6725_01815 [Planctomycetota bacterium]
MKDQAFVLRRLVLQSRQRSAATDASVSCLRLAVACGKGGTGKTTLAINLAVGLAGRSPEEADGAGRRVCLLDTAEFAGNADLMCGAPARQTLADVLAGDCWFQDAVLSGPGGISLICGFGSVLRQPRVPNGRQADVWERLRELESNHDVLVFDCGPGHSPAIRRVLRTVDALIVVCTPDPAAVAEAYATIKAAAGTRADVFVVVNQAAASSHAATIVERLQRTARSFLRRSVGSLDAIPWDAAVRRSTERGEPLLLSAPTAPAAERVRAICETLRKRYLRRPQSRRSLFDRLRRGETPETEEASGHDVAAADAPPTPEASPAATAPQHATPDRREQSAAEESTITV